MLNAFAKRPYLQGFSEGKYIKGFIFIISLLTKGKKIVKIKPKELDRKRLDLKKWKI